MSELHKLKPVTAEPDPGVIEKLEDALVKARAGKLREVLIIGGYEGTKYFQNASFKEGPLMLGYLAMLQWKIVASMDGNEEEPD